MSSYHHLPNEPRLDESTASLLGLVYQLVDPIAGIICVITIEELGRRK